MSVKRKKLFWIVWAAGIILTLMLVLTVVGSWYLNSAHAQMKIRAIVAEKLGNTVQFQRVGLSFFFRPHLLFHQVRIDFPGVTTGSIQSLSVYPRLWPLLTGSFRIAKLHASSPHFAFGLSKQSNQVPEDDVSFSDVKEDIASVLSSMRSFAPALLVEVNDGRVALRKNDLNAYTGRNIRGRAALLPNGFDLKVWIEPDRLGPCFLQGRFIVEGNRIAAQDVQSTVLDSTLTSSVEIIHAPKGLQLADISLEGTLGQKTVQMASTLFRLPPEQTVRSPLTLSKARLVLKSESDFTLSGTLSISKGPSLTLAAHWSPDELFVKRLYIHDEAEQSTATVTFRQVKKRLDFTFYGSLSENTLNRLFEEGSFKRGKIQGDIKAHVQLDRLQESNAEGVLEGFQVVLPVGTKVPLQIDHVSVRASGKTITVNSGVFSWGNLHGDLKGSLQALESGLVTDADLSAETVKMEDLRHVLAKDEERESAKETAWPPLSGTMRVNAKNFSYGQYSAAPFRADLTLKDWAVVQVAVTDATICGISLPGKLTWIEDDLHLDFRPVSVEQPLESTIACLWGEDSTNITGTFDLRSHLRSGEKSDTFARSLQGWAAFSSREGEIYQYPLLTRIFAAINVTDMLRGKFPDLSKEGFAYNTITIKGRIRGGKFLIREATIDGVSANLAAQGEIDFANKQIDITVLVAPFKTVDLVVKYIPLVNKVLGNTLITIPVKVTGDLGDPNVTILSPTAIGEGLIGIMKRTLQLPFTVIEPVLPGEKKRERGRPQRSER